jgi:hypothetical protein
MSVGRQFNWKGQMRVDAAHMRLVESSIAYDFDTLAGQALSGGKSYVVSGFTIAPALAGSSPSALQLVTAGSVVFHYLGSENGTMLFVPVGRPAETLSVTNPRVVGGFTAGQTNYVGIDFLRSEDATTSDIVQFLDATTLVATPKTIPLGRTLDYVIHISLTPFSGGLNICPVAKVVVASDGTLTSVADARPMYFRLAQGGDSPNPLGTYAWSQGRAAEDVTLFTGGDKAITSEKDWKSAIMNRIWEVTGGQYWYSDTTDRNLKVCYAPVSGLSDNMVFVLGSNNLKWENISIIFATNTGSVGTPTINTIINSATLNYGGGVGAGATILDGQALYVDVDRFNNNATLTPAIGYMYSLGSPSHPGSRIILAMRVGNNVYIRERQYELGRSVNVPNASTTTLGIVRTSNNYLSSGNPYVVSADGVDGKALASGITRAQAGSAGNLDIGGSGNDTLIRLLSATSGTSLTLSSTLSAAGISSTTTVAATTSISAGTSLTVGTTLAVTGKATSQATVYADGATTMTTKGYVDPGMVKMWVSCPAGMVSTGFGLFTAAYDPAGTLGVLSYDGAGRWHFACSLATANTVAVATCPNGGTTVNVSPSAGSLAVDLRGSGTGQNYAWSVIVFAW